MTSAWLKHAGLLILPGLALTVLALIAWASVTYAIPVEIFTRDMAVLARFAPFVSIASSLGAFLMCATAACSLFAFSAVRGAGRVAPWALFAAGAFSLYLTIDDFYELHDRVLPNTVGVPQQLVLGSIVAAAGAITFRWWRTFLGFRPWLLGAALAFLGGSIACDMFDEALVELIGQWQFFVEDGAKLFGISLWATYFIAFAQHTLSLARA